MAGMNTPLPHLIPSHGHAQIQYNDGATESLIGFNPRNPEDMATVHAMLDEFIQLHVIPALAGKDNKRPDLNYFTISGYVD